MPSEKLIKPVEWNGHTIPELSGGLNTMKDVDFIQEVDSPKLLNVVYRSGRIASDTGFGFEDDLANGGTGAFGSNEYIKDLFDFISPGGQSETLIITNRSMYKLVAGDIWNLIPNGVSSNSTGRSGNDILVPDGNIYTVGHKIGFYHGNGTYGAYTITAKGAGFITVSASSMIVIVARGGIPNPTAITQGALFTDDPNGEFQVVGIQVPSAGWYAFTNQQDFPFYYDGSNVLQIPQLVSRQVVCKTMAIFANHLVLGGCTESGVDRPWRVMWSDTANYLEWGDGVGNAGHDDLADTRDDIIAMKPLGQYNMIYRRRSFVRQEFEGSDVRLFYFRRIVLGSQQESAGIGAVSSNAVFAMQDFHVFVSDDGVYKYQGGYSVEPVSARVFRGFFDKNGEVSRADVHKIFVQFCDETNEVFLFYRTNSPRLMDHLGGANFAPTRFCDRLLRLNLENGSWWLRDLPAPATAAGIHFSEGFTTWDQLVGSWEQQVWKWNSSSIGHGTPRVAIGAYQVPDTPANQNNAVSPRSPRVIGYDYISAKDLYYPLGSCELNDDGNWFIETKNFHFLDFVRLDFVEYANSGGRICVLASNDRGQTWIPICDNTNPVGDRYDRAYKQLVAKNFMFRIEGNDTGRELGSFAFALRPESQW